MFDEGVAHSNLLSPLILNRISESVIELRFPQNDDEISTCGNRLWMSFSDVLKVREIKGILRRIFFEKKS
jgi:hypothetical protein